MLDLQEMDGANDAVRRPLRENLGSGLRIAQIVVGLYADEATHAAAHGTRQRRRLFERYVGRLRRARGVAFGSQRQRLASRRNSAGILRRREVAVIGEHQPAHAARAGCPAEQ